MIASVVISTLDNPSQLKNEVALISKSVLLMEQLLRIVHELNQGEVLLPFGLFCMSHSLVHI